MIRQLARSVALAGLALPALLLFLAVALSVRSSTKGRSRAGEKPRLVYGPVPIISIKYMSEAMRRRGYDARTVVYGVYPIHTAEDFDYDVGSLAIKPRGVQFLLRIVRLLAGPYLVFAVLLAKFDVFHFFFNGGFLVGTPLRFLEVQLIHLANKKVVVMPYGSDVAVPSQIRSLPFRHGLSASYPHLAAHEARTLRQIRYFSRYADLVIACIVHLETLPRWDLLTTLYYPIDTDAWRSPDANPDSEGGGPVTIAHAPNHRALKGTELLLSACESLQDEGLDIRLLLLERMPNTEVRRQLETADIVAEQFILGYALTALEGMSLAKPVLSNLSDESYTRVLRLYTGLDECPIVNTPPDKLKENLRRLVEAPRLRRELGEAGRRYVMKFHSYDAVGRMWELVYRKIWFGEDLSLVAWHPDQSDA